MGWSPRLAVCVLAALIVAASVGQLMSAAPSSVLQHFHAKGPTRSLGGPRIPAITADAAAVPPPTAVIAPVDAGDASDALSGFALDLFVPPRA